MHFNLPADLEAYIGSLDKFIHETILPLQHADDNNRFFDYRREHARTDWDNGGLPRKEWEALLCKLDSQCQSRETCVSVCGVPAVC